MKTMHALLVDDDTSALETMGMILEMDDYRVSTAANGLAALERLEDSEENPPKVDFLVLDLDMDRLSGIELLTEMRKRGHTLPVMVVSGYASKKTVVELMRHGVIDFLDKPLHMEEFRNRVQRIAKQALRGRKEIPAPVPGAHSRGAATVMDLGNLGIPYALRRLVDSSARSSLVMAARKPFGFEILLTEVSGDDSESFFLSVIIKTFFDRNRSGTLTGPEFLGQLNDAILKSSLKKQPVRAILLRIHQAGKRIELLPAGLASQLYKGLGETDPRTLSLCGSPLGMDGEPGRTLCTLPYNSRDRLYLVSGKNVPDPGSGQDWDFEPACLQEAILQRAGDSLDDAVESIWSGIHTENGPEQRLDAILLGIELP